MKRINVTSDICCNLNTIDMEFLNGGKIIIPSKYDGYVIASGCGSGKTTIIKELIRTQRYTGILYSASTIKECNEMYEWVKELYISEGIEDELEEDVIVLHSDYRSEGTNNNLWRNNPEELSRKVIIICTHYKLLNEFPELLIRYRRNPINYDDISYTQRATMNVPELNENGELVVYQPRQLILIDELPTCNSFTSLRYVSILSNIKMNTRILIFSNSISIRNYNKTRELIEKKFINSDKYKEETFKLDGIDNITYPRKYYKLFIETKDKNSFASRAYRLINRSTQEKLMDLLVRINYFNIKIHREVPFICDNKYNEYYFADYYIPECNLVIELDSDYHDEIKDKVRDRYFENLDIKVIRFKDFSANDEELNKIKEEIILNKSNPIKINFYNYKNILNNLSDYNKKINYFYTENKLLRKIIEKYGTKFIYGEGEVESKYSDKIYRNEVGIINII